MLDVDQRLPKAPPSSLSKWAYCAIRQPGLSIRIRLRGNNLHILCEHPQGVEANKVVNRLIKALKLQQGEAQFPLDLANPIYQIIVYGRRVGQKRPDWIKQIAIKLPTDDTTHASKQSSQTSFDAITTDADLTVSNESLARSGEPDAIARYLSESLSYLSVSVKVRIQHQDSKARRFSGASSNVKQTNRHPSPPNRRLWIICNSHYSPDPSLLSEPIIDRLHSLQLQGFRDAVICFQVSGEATPDWKQRVDLTPPEQVLKEWARWGDVEAIQRLLNQGLAAVGITVRAILKESTLHVFCSVIHRRKTIAPEKETVVSAIASVLDLIAPQGIQGATIYGVDSTQFPSQTLLSQQADSLQPPFGKNGQAANNSLLPETESPAWIHWLNLPAADHQSLGESTYSLAQTGHHDALTFLLERLLNPDIDQRLVTGGIRVKIRRKQDLLHIMSEATVCPRKSQVTRKITRFLEQLAMSEITGLRLYGRRAGGTSPSWNYGVDFVHRQRLVPEATPEFAASDAYLSDLVTPTGEPVLRRDLTHDDLNQGLKGAVDGLVYILQRLLCYSQLFVPTLENQDMAAFSDKRQAKGKLSIQGVGVAMVWGVAGLLLTLITDWRFSELLQSQASPSAEVKAVTNSSPKPIALPQLSLQKGAGLGTENFNTSGFTAPGDTMVIVNENGNATMAAMLAAARSPNPSFNNQMLDEKLALYQQRLLQSGIPDVLIMGSSRAMRGIDPIALQDALEEQGYPDIDVFNFGVNGATAQVVDFMVRRVLTPEQLPKLIIWADGVRAFNNGRVDATYNSIIASPGYEALMAGVFPNRTKEPPLPTDTTDQPLEVLNDGYQFISGWLNESIAKISLTYPHRSQLKSLLQEKLVDLEKFLQPDTTETAKKPQNTLSPTWKIDFDGFLPLSTRFNTATYYQKHPKVPGIYDGDYRYFQLGGQQDRALRNLMEFAQKHDLSIVMVNLPLTKEYLDPVRTKYEKQFQRYMYNFDLEGGLIFRDFNKMLLTKHDYFSDPSHLNRYGAYQVSNQLAKDPIMPWSLVISD
ncbi:DUF1574 domain-containing protein [Moorena producens PAL-8-15-08-1]|uniref:DUF1574 domain-containing protein n=1 Tax=Moorena producens PAL-8-15-08-1 TaxID=1458985 RepID=A0A1D8U2F8_9CYAN|nr:DUF1574 domain-containing protein [Moorena producens PAL-8-15-08-1]